MSRSIAHQDASGHMPLGVFHNNHLLAVAPADDRLGEQTREQVAAEHGQPVNQFEVLLLCHRHPDTAAVDCTACVPDDTEEKL